MKAEGRRNTKCLAYVAVFVVFQTAIILVFALTVMRVKSPKVRFGTLSADNFSASNSNSPSFNMNLVTQIAVKNTNFGHFKYENATVTIYYHGMAVGEALILKGRAKARSTKRVQLSIPISSDKLTSTENLAKDMNSGILPLTSQAKLSGKVHLMKVIKKKKSAEMSCSLSVNLSNRAIQSLNCK